MNALDSLAARLPRLDNEGLRRRTLATPGTGGRIRLEDGRTLLNFSSNDYLDLARDPEVIRRSVVAVEEWGCGATASRLMAGSLDLHEELELSLARMVGGEGQAALVFSSGFGMNVGILSAIAGRDDVVFADRLSHASLIDGIRLSGAALKRFAHNDLDMLEKQLRATVCRRHRIVVCESVYSMDGDLAPLAELRCLADEYEAVLLTDEAHAVGVFGQGGGLSRQLGRAAAADLTVGTLGKALGGIGGFAVCDPQIRECLVNSARSFIYATALPPGCAASALGAVERIENDPAMGERLLKRSRAFHQALRMEGLHLPEFGSQIIPIHVGGNERAVAMASQLRARGILATAVRPPTVPQGTARLRLSVTLAHSPADLAWAAAEIASVARGMGAI